MCAARRDKLDLRKSMNARCGYISSPGLVHLDLSASAVRVRPGCSHIEIQSEIRLTVVANPRLHSDCIDQSPGNTGEHDR